MYNRAFEWIAFAQLVHHHIVDYTIPQYGDSPTDEVEKWTPEQCILSIGKYVRRFESSRRGPKETLRDMFKIAHFACFAYFKLCKAYGVQPIPKSDPINNPFVHGSERKEDAKQSD